MISTSRGSVTVSDGRVRFVPTGFWARRGFHDWERVPVAEVDGGRGWRRWDFDDGSSAVVRT